jgi:2-hydroxy-6-oxonona-2,4-dienedioate hydrolase
MRHSKTKIENKYVTVAGRSLRYRIPCIHPASGRPSIVMLHGLIVSSRYMLPTALQLAPSYHVYIPELPGFGKSQKPTHYQNLDEMADTLAAWMDAINLPSAILLGNSLGCQIIAHFAVRHPQKIVSAILISPTMDKYARTAHQEIARWLLNITREPVSVYPIVIRDFIDIGLPRFIATFHYGLQDRIENFLPQLHIPTLIVRGSRDPLVPQLWVELVASLPPQAQLVIIKGAGHNVNYNSPTSLTHSINTFLNP